MKLALLFGGRGAERTASLFSARTVLPRLLALGHEVLPIGVTPSGSLVRYTGTPDALDEDFCEGSAPLSLVFEHGTLYFKEGETRHRPELVFSVLHGLDGEDGAWQGALTLGRIPFVGASVTASAIAMNKRITKELAAARGIPTVPYLSVRRYDAALPTRLSSTLTYPLFVKPATGGSSVGVTRVTAEEALEDAVTLALSYSEEVLIEEAVAGTEIEVAVLERDGVLLLSPPGEIRVTDGFYDYTTKYQSKTAEIRLPASLSLWETAYVKQLAASVFRMLGCRDLARVDFLRRADGKIFFNEINTLPGFTEDSLFPRLFALIGVDAVTFLTEGRL